MLDTQYRMHEDICEFPSNEFYNGNLKTKVRQQRSVFQIDSKTKPIVFGDVKGKTISLVVNTAQGNQNSKANLEERNKVVQYWIIAQQSIVILSPYNAQVSEIRNELMKKKMEQIPVTTITKSQGSEWRYVILSTVCSLPNEEIERQPERSWLSKHLGFVGDPNQINVAITRAKEGLCIIGEIMQLCRSVFKNYADVAELLIYSCLSLHY
uniref:DNA2/NAM7 helicase-like C-terminal domain-containing protein n=1 Tax=Oreochromis niloticus TaxID=8128 RepID=A0A669CWG8_ORENI